MSGRSKSYAYSKLPVSRPRPQRRRLEHHPALLDLQRKLKTRRIDPLTEPSPFRELCRGIRISILRPNCLRFERCNGLCMPFRYFFAFRSKMVYLSLGNISSSLGISLYHRSTAFALSPPFLFRAELTVSTTLSTSLNRFRCRAFCGLDNRHGIFLVAKSQISWCQIPHAQ